MTMDRTHDKKISKITRKSLEYKSVEVSKIRHMIKSKHKTKKLYEIKINAKNRKQGGNLYFK